MVALQNALRYVPAELARGSGAGVPGRAQDPGPHLRISVSPARGHHGPPGGRVPRHTRGSRAAGEHRQQPGLRRGPLPVRAGHLRRDRPGVPELDAVPAGDRLPAGDDGGADPGDRLRASRGPVPHASQRATCHQHQRAHGGRVRQRLRLPRRRPAGGGQLRADDGGRLDVHRAAGDRARHLPDPAERGPALPGHPGARGPGRRPVPELRAWAA